MRIKFKYLLILLLVNFLSAQEKTWVKQPNLSLDDNLNLVFKTKKNKKAIFPIMLYSFVNWNETKNELFWKEINNWGVNIVYTWDVENEKKIISYANKYNIIVLLNNVYDKNNSFYALPDEPIGGGSADLKKLDSIKKSHSKSALSYLNHDVSPYYFRKQNDKNIDPFDSKLNCTWCKHGKGTDLSYSEANKFADIIAFDFYPYNSDGVISRNVNDFGETSVGEFTKLIKMKYPNKPIWPVIQTLWFSPYNDDYKGNVINLNIIRNLTFDAIINGADGISFFGHGQTSHYKNQKGYEFLNNYQDKIWKETLYQCYELSELQKKYDNILLQNNIYTSSSNSIVSDYSFSIKKVTNKNIFYVFVVNHLKENKLFDIKIPSHIISNNLDKIEKVGLYNYPKLMGISDEEQIDFRNTFHIEIKNNNILSIKMEPYGVAIFKITV